jgi:N-acetylneuraminic acid mutarotase
MPRLAWLAVAAACGASSVKKPSAPGWTALAPMLSGQGEAAAAALDGKIYLAGGYDTHRALQIYDTATGAWTAGPLLPAGTDNAGAIAYGGKLYFVGGEAAVRLQIYDPAANSWSAGPALPSPRFSSSVELIDAQVHVAGGWSFDRSNNVSIATHDAWDLAAGSWITGKAPMKTARNHAVSGVIGGKLYVVGGRGPGHEAEDASNLASVEAYDPAADAWTDLAPLPTPRSGGAAAVLDGKLYVLGGGLPGNTVYKTIERFDPAAGAWEKLDDMPVAITGHRAVAVGTSLYVMGGFTSNDGQRTGFAGVSDCWRYDPPH